MRHVRDDRWLCVAGLVILALFGCSSDGNEDGGGNNTPPTSNAVFVLTSDFTTSSYSVIDTATQETFQDIDLDGVSSDAGVARFSNGLIYIVNRLGSDNIQVIDPQRGYLTPPGAQVSVGNGSNPQDIALVSATKAYVSRLASPELLIINPTTLAVSGRVDLRALLQPGDSDGSPEPAYMLVHQGLLYVALQHLELFVPIAPGQIVVIDPANDTIRETITLTTMNPITELQYSAALDRILIGSTGDFGVADGAIEAIDPDTFAVSQVIDEESLGGDLTHFVIVSATQGFAVTLGPLPDLPSSLVSFNPTTGAFRNTLLGPLEAFLSHFAVTRSGELFLAVNDRTAPVPQVFVFDVDQERETARIPTGILPPVYILPVN